MSTPSKHYISHGLNYVEGEVVGCFLKVGAPRQAGTTAKEDFIGVLRLGCLMGFAIILF